MTKLYHYVEMSGYKDSDEHPRGLGTIDAERRYRYLCASREQFDPMPRVVHNPWGAGGGPVMDFAQYWHALHEKDAEIKRLRKALQRIAESDRPAFPPNESPIDAPDPDVAWEVLIARQALKGTQ